jgi:catechol 2,3-dioxygenase-like lactoylglutathione lyase family enzyme
MGTPDWPELGPVVQIAYAVPDAESAARRWAVRHRAGPFFLARRIPVDDVVVRGVPGVFAHTSAYGQWGGLMVELVQRDSDDPSPLTELPCGLHHLAFFVDDLDAASSALGTAGVPLAMSARAGETRFLFHDARADLGHFLELYEPSSRLLGFYAMVRDAALGWDGRDPVRVMG